MSWTRARRRFNFHGMSDEAPSAIQMLSLERVDGSKNISRYYVLSITPSLFVENALVREWDRIGTSVRRHIEIHDDRAGAGEALQVWLKRKTKRGYVVAHQT